ncbi:hypothetical protein TRAPUB_6888 [Trametes pubescens]|uniref:F-box domain-containing protein n=1 Tax=Trametes pubescens TaxID=154538 RepID=A0A1M2V4Q8_TRAPU|nr:hypothetical protein TRAPUB_6888 [Trametes pubescens]
MDTLPLETLQHIFQLACTDGAYTGCSLSLVSHAVRTIACTARFHSVSLDASLHRLQVFVDLYQRECDLGQKYKPRVRHLHVSFPFIPPRNPRASDLQPTATPEYLSAAQTLFQLVAADLVTLVVQFTNGGSMNLPLIARPFPHLLEATFVGVQDFRTLLSTSEDANSATPLFPVMSHVYVVPSRRPGALCLPFWAANAPRATHLSVSRAEDHLEEISAAVGVRVRLERSWYRMNVDWDRDPGPPSPPTFELPLTPTYPSVRHLLVQPGPGPVGARCGNAWMGHNQRRLGLRQMGRSCRAIGVEVVEAEALVYGKSIYETVRHGWLARINDSGDAMGFLGAVAHRR